MKLLSFLLFSSSLAIGHSRLNEQKRNLVLTFPLYDQQCDRDDGPRFENDEETFGAGVKYYTESSATPVLEGGQCAEPLRNACAVHNDIKTAYMEGPIDCGGNGFFCTVVEQDDWDPRELLRNANFGYCNTTGAFDSTEYEEDGHCHGSDDDTSYYWLLRDHWFRQYNGRLRCCCNWNSGEDNLFEGRFTNRCDYRRAIPERLEGDCISANKNNRNFEGGCDASLRASQIGSPVPEDEAKCWEVTHFGQPKPVFAVGEPCENDPNLKFKDIAARDCTWVGRNPEARCEREWNGKDLLEYCPKFCGLCPKTESDVCEDDPEFAFNDNPKLNCAWVGRRNSEVRCNRFWHGERVGDHCPVACDECE